MGNAQCCTSIYSSLLIVHYALSIRGQPARFIINSTKCTTTNYSAPSQTPATAKSAAKLRSTTTSGARSSGPSTREEPLLEGPDRHRARRRQLRHALPAHQYARRVDDRPLPLDTRTPARRPHPAPRTLAVDQWRQLIGRIRSRRNFSLRVAKSGASF